MLARTIRTVLTVSTAFHLASCTVPSASNRAGGWQPVPLQGVSGLAPAGSSGSGTQWLAVSDAKGPGEPRAALVQRSTDGTVQTRTLRWIGREPVDMEAISAVPGTVDRFVATTSKGEWFITQLTDSGIRVTGSGTVPGRTAIKEMEGFSVARLGNRTFAVWGNRGSDTEPGRLFWSEWTDSAHPSFGPVQSTELRMPWPRKHVRHISDLKLDANGRLLVSSASDPGDQGPFSSAVWEAGRFEVADGSLVWKPLAAPVQLLREGPDGHKVEAIAEEPNGRLVVASDDEAGGSAIRFSTN